jgi:potassium efflux system protein
MADHILPNSLAEILGLAAVLLFLLTTAGAILAAVLIARDNLFYLGFQLIGLSVALILSRGWLYDLAFAGILDGQDAYLRCASTAFILACTYTIDMGLKVFVWEGVLARDGREAVPRLLVNVVRVLIYLIGLLTVLQFVYDQSITALATLSGAFAIVLGLSAQSTLGEMFAGIAIALSRPFRIGDWVKFGQMDEGRVIDMTWRLVRLELRDRTVVHLTNRQCADLPVKNFSFPNNHVRMAEDIFFPRGADQARIKKVIRQAISEVPTVLADPLPNAVFMGVRDGVDHYSMRFYIREYNLRRRIVEQVWLAVAKHLAREDMPIAQPRQVVDQHTRQPETPPDASPA